MKIARGSPTVDGDDGVARSEIDLRDTAGLRLAWTTYAPELLGYAGRALSDRAGADEAVQETFLRAWRAAPTFDRNRPLRPWLFAILRNVIVDMARSRQRRAVPHDREADDARGARVETGTDEARLDTMFDEWMLHEAFRRLRDDQRIVLVDAFYRGRPYADIARQLGVPEGTVRSRAFYGLRTLRLVLEEMGWEP